MCPIPDSSGFDKKRADAFADRLVNTLNDGALCLMISIGHRTSLFDALNDMPAASSREIAERAGLNERYVREWLGAMTTSGVLEFDSDQGSYHLPPEHAAFLCRKSNADNIAVFAQYIPLLGSIEDDIVECFHNGGGVPYARYPRFHAVMAEDSGQSVLSSLFEHILPLAPGLINQLEQGIRALDVGCGSGRALNMMAEHYPKSEFVGYDLSRQAISIACDEAESKALRNVSFEIRDLSDFDVTAEDQAFDFITTFDAVHDQAKPRALLKGIHRSLKSDGIYLMQDIHGSSHLQNNMNHPIGTLLYTISCLHCMTVSLAQGGEGLGAMWGRELAEELLREAGFTSVKVHRLEHDFQNDYYVITKT